MERKQTISKKEQGFLKSNAAALLMGESLKGFYDSFEAEIKKINSPNFRQAESPDELDLIRLRRTLLAEPVQFAYHNYKIRMYGSRDELNNLTPYLQLADLRIYLCGAAINMSSREKHYRIWHQGIFFYTGLSERELIKKLNELFRLNRGNYTNQ